MKNILNAKQPSNLRLNVKQVNDEFKLTHP